MLAYITEMKRWKTKNSGSPYWLCSMTNGETVNVFKHDDPQKNSFHHFETAGYAPEMLALQLEESVKWNNTPIMVEVTKKGSFWDIFMVFPRPENCQPDSVTFKPNAPLARAESLAWVNMIMNPPVKVAFIDCETDSLDGDADLTSIGIKIMPAAGGGSIEHYETYIKPPRFDRLTRASKNGKSAADVTGITPEFLQDKPTLKEVYAEIHKRLDGVLWVIYNAEFDHPVIIGAFTRAGLTPPIPLGVHCAMKRLAAYNGEWDLKRSDWKWKTLTAAAGQFGVEVENAHNAAADVETTYQIIKRLFWDEAAAASPSANVGIWDVVDRDERP